MKHDKITEQKLEYAMSLGNNLLAQNGLTYWKMKYDNRRSSLAVTIHDKKIISFSKYFIFVANKSQLEGVTLHEITHALLGPGYGHSNKFISLCKRIGATTKYTRCSIDIPIRKYIATCPECGYRGSYNKNNKVLYCAKCFKKGKIVKFEFIENETKVVPL